MGANDWVHDEGEVQRSVEAITEFFRSNPLLGVYTALPNFVYRGRQVFLSFQLKSYTSGFRLPVYWKTHATERRGRKT